MTTVARSAEEPRSSALAASLVAFLVANLIHNDFGIDPAIAPAALFGVLYWRTKRAAFLWWTALVVALPSFLFLKPGALLAPGDARPFLNHVALLAAGSLAVVSVLTRMRSHLGARGGEA